MPWVMHFIFNIKKITIKDLWEEIFEKIEKKFREHFEIIEFR